MNTVEEDDVLLQVDLDWCDFYIHVHELALSKRIRDVAMHVGKKLGTFKEVDLDLQGRSWGLSMRLRVQLNVNKPLKWAIKIRTTAVDEHMVFFTYEKLPNICYLCGVMDILGSIVIYNL